MTKLRNLLRIISPRFYSNGNVFNIKLPELDLDYLCDPNNLEEISTNIASRKGMGNIELVQSLKKKLDSISTDDVNREAVMAEFISEVMKIPNKTHPSVKAYGEEPKIINEIGIKRKFDHKPREFEAITKALKLMRTDQLGNVSGSRSYFFMGEMVELEQALIRYTVRSLLDKNYKLFSVPDLLDRNIIESCGMNTRGARNQVRIHDYTL